MSDRIDELEKRLNQLESDVGQTSDDLRRLVWFGSIVAIVCGAVGLVRWLSD